MSLDGSASPQTDVSPYEIHVDFQDDGEPSKAVSEPSALVREALQLPAAKESTVSEVSPIVAKNHGDGVGNVMHHLAVGVGNEIVEHPLALAGNAALGFGMGYATKVGLASQVWRRPTIAGLAVMGGVAAIDLISSAPGWFKSASIASDTSGKSLEEVQAAEKHLQSLGGGALELGVGGVTGGLAFKPSIAAATESMLSRTRAAVFSANGKSTAGAAGEGTLATQGAAGESNGVIAEALAAGADEPFKLSGIESRYLSTQNGRLFHDFYGRAAVHERDGGFVEIFQYSGKSSNPSHVKLIEPEGVPVVAKFTEDGVRIPLANGEEAFWKGSFDGKNWVKGDSEKFHSPLTAFLYVDSKQVRMPTYWNLNQKGEVILAEELNTPPAWQAVADTKYVRGPSSVGAPLPEKSSAQLLVADGSQTTIGEPKDIVSVRFGKGEAEAAAVDESATAIVAPKDIVGRTLLSESEKSSQGWLRYSGLESFVETPVSRIYFDSQNRPKVQLYWEAKSDGDGLITEAFRYNDGALTPSHVKIKTESGMPLLAKFSNEGVRIPLPDGGEILWKGKLTESGWAKAAAEEYDNPGHLARLLPAMQEGQPRSWKVQNAEVVLREDYVPQFAAPLQDRHALISSLQKAEAIIIAENVKAKDLIHRVESKDLKMEQADRGITHYDEPAGLLSSRRAKTTVGNWNQYYQYGDRNQITEIVAKRRGDTDSITVWVNNNRFFVSGRDGSMTEWKGVISQDGIFSKAPDEIFATPYDLAKIWPQLKYGKQFENGRQYAAQIDSWATTPEKREFFTGEPRKLVKMVSGHEENYFRYDSQGNMVGWTFKPDPKFAPFELKVTDQGVVIPHPSGQEIVWQGTFKNGVWRKAEDEEFEQPYSLINHLYSRYLA